MRTWMLLLVLLVPVPLAAQGLGDTAAQERQKRAEKKPAAPAKVFTNEDLPEPASPPAGKAAEPAGKDASAAVIPRDPGQPGPEGSATSADPSRPGPTEATRDDKQDKTDPLEKERQQRKLLEAEWRVRFANARAELATAEANSWQEVVRTELYQGIPVQMRVKEQIQTDELKQARQALADLEEEFRRTGLPPGWARES